MFVVMNIYTSCFRSAKNLDSSKFFVVSISRFPPKWFQGYRCYDLAPSVFLLRDFKAGLSPFHYAQRFRREVLDRVDVHKVFEFLASMSCGRDIVLCCFEPAFEFCHRRLVASYVKEVWGYSIDELI